MASFKERLHKTNDKMTLHMCTIPSVAIPQALAAGGADGIFVDLEHGAIDYAMAHAMIAATAGTNCAPLARIAAIDTNLAKRALDMGATGLVFPMVRTAQDARDAVACLRYPPNGTRGFGPFLAQSRWQTNLADYRDKMEPQMVCMLLIETREAVENIDEICAVEGIDIITPALFDLSTDLGLPGQFDHPDFVAAVTKVENAAKKAGLPLAGIGLTRPQATQLLERGYRIIAGVDSLWLRAQAAEVQGWLAH